MSNRIEKASIEISDYAQSISRGGTSGMSVEQASVNLGYVRNTTLGANGGIAKTNSFGKLPSSTLSEYEVAGNVNTIGPVTTAIGGIPNTFVITNYDSFSTYTVSTTNGSVSINGETITFTPNNVSGQSGFTINGEFFSVTVIGVKPNTPSITYPTTGASNVPSSFTATCSAFGVSQGNDTHHSTRWQVSTSPTFVTLVYESIDNPSDKITWTCGPLVSDTQYYIRASHKGTIFGYSDWSPAVVFDTALAKPNTPTITSPVNGSTGAGTKVTATTDSFSSSVVGDTHVATHWQVSASSSFTVLASESVDDTVNKLTWVSGSLAPTTMYYVRARHKGSVNGYSEWSVSISFTTGSAMPASPSITSPSDGAVNIGKTVQVTASSFSVINGTDTHVASHWQLSTSATFATILYESADDTINKTTWTSGTLSATTQYYIRVRYKGTTYGYGAWSEVIAVTTNSQVPDAPTITSPYNGSTDATVNQVISCGALSVTNGTDTHVATHWQLSTNSSFSNILYESIDDTVNKTSWSPGTLVITTTYYVRAKHKGGSFGYSPWSSVSSFTTKTPKPDAPTITSPSSGSSNQLATVNFSSSGFSISGFSDTHSASHWQISTSNSFSSIISESMDSTSNKTTWGISNLTANTQYYVRVRYKGSSYGYGDWSSYYYFTTKSSFLPTSEVQILSGSDTVNGNLFGESICLSNDGNTLLVGASGNSQNGLSYTGAAYVFTKSGSSWSQQARIVPNDVSQYMQFGYTVHLSDDGNTAAIQSGVRAADPGTVYIFTRSGSTWSQQAKINSSVNPSQYGFGQNAVGLSSDGSKLVIGSSSDSSDTGAVHVYTRSGSSWSLQQVITANYGSFGDWRLGYAVCISGDGSTIFATALPRSPSNGSSVYVFVSSGSSWSQQSRIIHSDSVHNDGFGLSLSAANNGSIIAIGAPIARNNSLGASTTGAVFVYTRAGSSWSQQAKLISTDMQDASNFGYDVTISSDGTIVLAGVPDLDVSGGSNNGGAYLFKNNGGSWSQQAKIVASNSSVSSNLGKSVALAGGVSAVALSNKYGQTGGNVYMFI